MMYGAATPMLNPFICSLRNDDIKSDLTGLLDVQKRSNCTETEELSVIAVLKTPGSEQEISDSMVDISTFYFIVFLEFLSC
jgi:hypothetical protein